MDEDFRRSTGIKVGALDGPAIVIHQLLCHSRVVLCPEEGPDINLARGVRELDERSVEREVLGITPNIIVTNFALEE